MSGVNILMLRNPLGLLAVRPLGLATGLVGSWKAAGTAAEGDAESAWTRDDGLALAVGLAGRLIRGAEAFKLDLIGLSVLGDLGVCILACPCLFGVWLYAFAYTTHHVSASSGYGTISRVDAPGRVKALA